MAAPAAPATAHGMKNGTGYNDTTTGAPGYGASTGDGYGGRHGRPGLFHRDSQPGFPEYGTGRRFANPAPAGLFALAATTLMWSLFNARARHITEVNAIVGMALLVGGLCTLLAGMWEFAIGNTFGATAFTLLGGFWGSYGVLYWPGSGSLSAYGSDLGSALGIYFMVWMIVALMLLLGTFRSSAPLAGTFFFLFLMYMLIGIANFTGRTAVLRAGGVIGCIAAMFAFYSGAVGLHNRDTGYYALPPIGLPKRRVDGANTANTANPRY
ncbi:hypothetical protein FS749_004149 [Ceratobasidium sp. UAMH 11750]|nr:hypothetical protein FS749_004149 [Ceratobasidium sp. UAMH 11750]